MTCKFVLKCIIREKWLVDNNDLVKAVAETFSIRICLFFSLSTLNCMNGVTNKFVLVSTIHLRKWIQLKVYSYLVKNVWISSFILTLRFWWLQLAVWEATESHQNFVFNFEDIWKRKFVFYQALIAFFHTGNMFHPECW